MLKQLKSQGDSSNTKHGETEGTVENRIIHGDGLTEIAGNPTRVSKMCTQSYVLHLLRST